MKNADKGVRKMREGKENRDRNKQDHNRAKRREEKRNYYF
jgi:hypothetical protein